MSAFFDHLIDTFSRLSKRGFIEVYRCISVPDLKKFLSKIENPKTKLGIFWSHNPGAADCNYHPDANHKYEITLVAKAPVSSIDWGQTFTTNFGHPMEEEVTVMGPVSGLRVIHDEQIVFTSSKTFATA